jgi:hypothetical protein
MGAAALLAMAALPVARPAHAQQTFICEDGGSVTVLPGQLELMKRTDPCVARHFQDQDLPEPGQGSEWETAAEPPPGSAPLEAPLPVKKPETLMADARAAAGSHVNGQRKPLAQVKSDYRHVHIINAGPGAPQFYEHRR